MSLAFFNINNFRNITKAELCLNEKCNFLCGKNASGKTSFLEAIYYLILGRSFRSHLLRRIVKHNEKGFTLFGGIQYANTQVSVGISKSVEYIKQIKIDGKKASSNIDLMRLAPVQLLNYDGYSLLSSGPKKRRQFLDWGLFHVKQTFLDLWRQVEQNLKQRNKAIWLKTDVDFIKMWDRSFSKRSYELHSFREQYIKSFIPIAKEIINILLDFTSIDIQYYAGWNTSLDFSMILNNNLKSDLQMGYTTAGPHRADLRICVGNVPAKDYLSRGQQKLLIYGLQIAQSILLNRLANKKCIFLIDDLLAELDFKKAKLLASVLFAIPEAQLFVTGLSEKKICKTFCYQQDSNIFNINEGVIT